jgi:sigma-B regulation protein RsbU (phosphoserine phosphatase)
MAGELVRSRTFRRRYTPDRATPSGVLASINTILHQRQLEEYFCTLCYANFDLRRRVVTLANSGLPYPVRLTAASCAQVELSGVPLGSFPGSTYDEIAFPLDKGDVYVFCSDGIFDAVNEAGDEFGPARLVDVVGGLGGRAAAEVVEVVAGEVEAFRGAADQNDDMTVVAVRIVA